MATTRRSLTDLLSTEPRVDYEKVRATTEADIERHRREDEGDEHDEVDAQALRKALGLTQAQLAQALRIPVSTLRNWEQGRVNPDPAARALLRIVAQNPQAAFKALKR